MFKLVTKPDIDRFVPKRLQHYIPGGELTYTDIIRYDPKVCFSNVLAKKRIQVKIEIQLGNCFHLWFAACGTLDKRFVLPAQLLENPPFELVVHSIPPVFKNKVQSCR